MATAEAQTEKVRAERYEIDVSFQPEKGFLHARAKVTLRTDQSLGAIEIELNPNLKILEVTDGQGRKLEFARSQRLGSPRLSVRLAEPAAGAITLTFIYEGVLPPKPLDYITKDGILLRDESRWYPAVDLAAFTQNEFHIAVPSGWQVITSGRPEGSIGSGLDAGYSWKTEQPVSSRSFVAIPSQPMNCVPTPVEKGGYSEIHRASACYIGPQQDSGKRMAAKAHNLLERYSKAFKAYPHPELLVVEGFSGQRGAIGYSAPGFLVVSEDVVKFHDYPGYTPEFLPHEVAHQWFPIEVTIATQEDGWLAEPLAEYLAWRYVEEKDLEQARRMVEFQVRVEMRLETSAGPVEHSVATRGLVTPFTVTTAQPVMRITLDPASRILRSTEAARRNRSQRIQLAKIGEFERARQFKRAVESCRRALALDPENLASNEQQIRFALGRLYYRMNLPARALQAFARVLTLGSLDPMESDFYRVWSRVYRARIERRQGHLAATRAEVRAGLETKSPALFTPVAWPETPEKPSTAGEALQALAR